MPLMSTTARPHPELAASQCGCVAGEQLCICLQLHAACGLSSMCASLFCVIPVTLHPQTPPTKQRADNCCNLPGVHVVVCMLHRCCMAGDEVVPQRKGVDGRDQEVPHIVHCELNGTVAQDGRQLAVPDACRGGRKSTGAHRSADSSMCHHTLAPPQACTPSSLAGSKASHILRYWLL